MNLILSVTEEYGDCIVSLIKNGEIVFKDFYDGYEGSSPDHIEAILKAVGVEYKRVDNNQEEE